MCLQVPLASQEPLVPPVPQARLAGLGQLAAQVWLAVQDLLPVFFAPFVCPVPVCKGPLRLMIGLALGSICCLM